MKKGLLILMLALVAGVAALYATRTHQQAGSGEALLDAMPELAWLRGELELTDDQFAKACELHAAYRPTCVEMCRRISETQTKLDSLARDARGMTPELAQAIHDHARVHAECQQRMLQHLYQTASLFDDRQAARYLETVLPPALGTPGGSENESPHRH